MTRDTLLITLLTRCESIIEVMDSIDSDCEACGLFDTKGECTRCPLYEDNICKYDELQDAVFDMISRLKGR